MGVQTVQLLSEADTETLFARESNEKIVVGPPPAALSYLNIEAIVRAAQTVGADAVHPGYGFLSENASFAAAIEKAGLCFVGPSSKSIAQLGNKISARELARKAGVPTTPGVTTPCDDETLIAMAEEIGFPVLIKAAAGGGGRGMRVAYSAHEFREMLPRAHAEAKKFFADETVFFEKFIQQPRHVEVQIFGDTHGNVVHLGTRDCSTQRRNQKLVEEAPAPNLRPSLREALHQAAIAVAKAAHYYNAGTAEFLVSGDQFYFLEMNTRIQVEHPVTESVTGLDLIEWQLRVAQGEPLPLPQAKINFTGHAIEYRMYAEDPARDFAPAVGKIDSLSFPETSYIRSDIGYSAGDTISLHYDAMIGKLIVTASSRQECIRRSEEALDSTTIGSIPSTRDFHRWLVRLSAFRSAPLSIDSIGKEFGPASLRELEASFVKDAAFVSAPQGAAHVEWLSYERDERISIRLLHRSDGLFVATPVHKSGLFAAPKNRRVSNGRHTAIRCLVEEVLNTQSVAALFPDLE